MIIPKNHEVSEHEAAEALLEYLPTCAYGEASFEDIKFYLPGKYLQLKQCHREMQRARPAEQMWFAAVRNIGAHCDKPGNAIYEGFLVKRRGGGYQLASRAKK